MKSFIIISLLFTSSFSKSRPFEDCLRLLPSKEVQLKLISQRLLPLLNVQEKCIPCREVIKPEIIYYEDLIRKIKGEK